MWHIAATSCYLCSQQGCGLPFGLEHAAGAAAENRVANRLSKIKIWLYTLRSMRMAVKRTRVPCSEDRILNEPACNLSTRNCALSEKIKFVCSSDNHNVLKTIIGE